ncbi:putative ABC transporter protein [Zychaea mexicana]|uniref:putative ABC transporter protein n=1 Tax=Zychaea mexicana TaxID=64656 RepID=UPI0022FEF31F|nr:putative ABC transporter protein [Zychaea mexicana]KAI9498760.1 putative ABC transporter protein [Zychaea mexicana]
MTGSVAMSTRSSSGTVQSSNPSNNEKLQVSADHHIIDDTIPVHQLQQRNNDDDIDDDGKEKKKSKKNKNKKAKRTVPVHKLFRFAKPWDKFMIAIACICSVLVGLLQPLCVVFFGLMINRIMDSIDEGKSLPEATQPIVIIFVILGTVILVLAYIANSFWIMSGENQTRRIRKLYIHSILRQDMAWFDQSEEGSLTTRLAADCQLIQDGISETFGTMIRAISAFVLGFIMAFGVGWNLAVIVLAVLPLLGGVGGLMGYLITSSTLKVQDAYADAGTVAEQVFSGVRTVYAFSLQKRFAEIYETKLVKARQAGVYRGYVTGLGVGGFLFVLFGIYAISFWYGGKLVKDEALEGWRVMVSFFVMILGAMSLLQLPNHVTTISTACGAAHKIFETIDRVPFIDPDSTEGITPDKVIGNIEFRNVQFQYPTRPDVPILKNLNLKIKPGMTVAFVGPSGSGKSTSIQLLQRFYDPTSGQVLLDGNSLKDINLKWLRSQVGVVSQEPVLFNMTIRQNLLMGVHHQVSQEEIIEACVKANCHTFISNLPKGYDTLVGEHGGMMSGGQKQRIAIARAILKNPPILLLDEATSALDTQSERLVQRALDVAAADRTTIVIAHRLSTIRNADLIVVMQQGDLVEQGSHNELVARNGVYAELVRKQQIATKQVGATEDEEFDEEELLRKENEELEQHITKAIEADALDEKEPGGQHLVRMSTTSSIDAYELKLHKNKEERKMRKKQSAPIGRILQQMRSEWPLLFLGSIGATLAGAVFPVFAFVIAKCIYALVQPPELVAPGPLEGANLYAFLFLMFAIIAFIGFGLQMGSFEVAGELYTERFRAMIFRAYLKQEIGYYDDEDNSVGALTSKLAVDSKNVNELVTKVPGDICQIIATVITGLVIAFYHDWKMTLIVLAMSPFVMGASFYESKIQRGFEDQTAKAHEHSGEIAGEAIKEIRTVAALDKQAYFEKKFKKALQRPHRLAKRKAFLSSIGYALGQGIILYVGAVSFYAGMHFLQDGKLAFDELFICLLSVMITVHGVGRASVFASTYAKAKNSALATFEILDRQSHIDPDLEGIEPATSTIAGDLSFDNITFRYPARMDMPIFDGEFNLGGKAGQTIALVGPSGCGKSTTIGMLQRWYDPIEGTVRLDEHNTKNFTLGNLRSHMALVGQEPVLFDMSIGENIRFGIDENRAVTQEQVEEAARAANIHNFVADLPDGYNTRVGDKGSQLSGGQKQRIAIARALIRKPKVLLLDEATSALDSESEKLVQAAIDNIISEGGRTTITIAHRLSTIQGADLICVIKDGRVVEQGTHWELLKLDGVYASLVRQQSLNAT